MDWKHLLSVLGTPPSDNAADAGSEGKTATERRTKTSVDFGSFTNCLLEGKAIPLTEIVVPSDSFGGSKLPSSPSQNSLPQINLTADLKPTDGVAIKPSVAKERRHIKCKAARQFLFSMLRNGLCWLLVACVVVIALEDVSEIRDWFDDSRVAIVVLSVIGLIGLPLQAVHAVREMRNKRASLLMTMLRQAKDVKDFKEMVRQRQLCPPYLAVEVSLKRGAMARVKNDADGWMLTTRKNIKVLDFNSWLDVSAPIADRRWEDNGSFWIILTKEYRFVDKQVEQATQQEVAQFKRDCAYDKYMYFMNFQYLLDVQQGDYFPDAEACLVYQKHRPALYKLNVYKASLCLALDMFYQIAFYLATKRAQDYYFVKFIER